MGRLTALAAFALIGANLSYCFADEDTPVAVGVQLSQDENAAKLVFDLSRSVDANASALGSPYRVVVDMPEVKFKLDPLVGRAGSTPTVPLVKSFRFGLLASGKSRIVVDLVRAACPTQVSSKPIVEGESAARLTIELKPCDPSIFAALISPPPRSIASGPSVGTPTQRVVVLDPGHGGVDSGARGLGGVQEKTIVFNFCAELKRQLDATKRYVIVMTRDDDQYVDLDDRVSIARKANASLFISVHADTLSEDANVSGSTVYTVADRASDVEAAHIAARENGADRAPGGRGRDLDVADILLDLKRRETRTYAHVFSRGLVENLKSATRLNHNPERSAGFVVLKAPEFPSVLVELGYLSNAHDVQSLTSLDWRAKAASAMVKEIDAFFAGNGNPGVVPSIVSGVASSAIQAAAPTLAH
jgi:N-acetylmuramoyl-L-alanine amidase